MKFAKRQKEIQLEILQEQMAIEENSIIDKAIGSDYKNETVNSQMSNQDF